MTVNAVKDRNVSTREEQLQVCKYCNSLRKPEYVLISCLRFIIRLKRKSGIEYMTQDNVIITFHRFEQPNLPRLSFSDASSVIIYSAPEVFNDKNGVMKQM